MVKKTKLSLKKSISRIFKGSKKRNDAKTELLQAENEMVDSPTIAKEVEEKTTATETLAPVEETVANSSEAEVAKQELEKEDVETAEAATGEATAGEATAGEATTAEATTAEATTAEATTAEVVSEEEAEATTMAVIEEDATPAETATTDVTTMEAKDDKETTTNADDLKETMSRDDAVSEKEEDDFDVDEDLSGDPGDNMNKRLSMYEDICNSLQKADSLISRTLGAGEMTYFSTDSNAATFERVDTKEMMESIEQSQEPPTGFLCGCV